MKTIIDNTATLVNTNNEAKAEAEVDKFQRKILMLISNKQNPMRWNGRVYVGTAHGMEFTSDGPHSSTKEGRR